MRLSCAWTPALVACLFAVWTSAHAQQAAPRPAAASAPAKKFPLVSTDECFKCHFTPAGNPAFDQSRDFCYIETAAIWEHQDKHRQALALLVTGAGRKLTERIIGAKLEDVLRFEIAPPDTAAPGVLSVHNVRFADPPQDPAAARALARHVATLKACFACHAPVEERVVGDRTRTTIENGVSCQACHGEGLAYEAPHQKPRADEQDERERRLRYHEPVSSPVPPPSRAAPRFTQSREVRCRCADRRNETARERRRDCRSCREEQRVDVEMYVTDARRALRCGADECA